MTALDIRVKSETKVNMDIDFNISPYINLSRRL